jgi:hypothetical protein
MVRNTDEVEVEGDIEETEEVREKKARSGAVVVDDLSDAMIEEALKDVLAVSEEIAERPAASQELRELIAFKEECEALLQILKQYVPEETLENVLVGESIDLKAAMRIAARMMGVMPEEELLNGEPSPYVQELFRKIWQKYIDCKWFFAMLRGKRTVTLKELRYAQMPEELKVAQGEKI